MERIFFALVPQRDARVLFFFSVLTLPIVNGSYHVPIYILLDICYYFFRFFFFFFSLSATAFSTGIYYILPTMFLSYRRWHSNDFYRGTFLSVRTLLYIGFRVTIESARTQRDEYLFPLYIIYGILQQYIYLCVCVCVHIRILLYGFFFFLVSFFSPFVSFAWEKNAFI